MELGQDYDVHWHFSAPGDTFLGRILAGFDPKEAKFAKPPPHWKVSEPLENEVIEEGMEVMFGPILAVWSNNEKVNPTSFLARWIQWTINIPGHLFPQIPLLMLPDLLEQLKELVTAELGGDVNSVSGIPPRIEFAQRVTRCS